MITSYSRGHKIHFNNNQWFYSDNNDLCIEERKCIRCGKLPTVEGYDNCIGYKEGFSSVCCGHGVEEYYEVEE